MPRLSDTMTEGVIAAWHKKVGDTVKKGDLLAEVETDKATMDLESYKDGTLLHIGVDKGGKLQVNDLLAIIGQPGEDISGLLKDKGSKNKENQKGQKDQMSQNEKTNNKQPASAEATAGNPATAEVAAGKTATAEAAAGKTATSSKQSVSAEAQSDKPVPIAIGTSNQQSIDISKMDEVVLMPRLSDTMTEGVIAAWHKNVGDTVKKGEVLAEIETDKATMDLESYKNGTLLYIGAKQGEKIAVNELLCIIGEKGKVDVDKIVAAAKGSQKGQMSQKSQSEEIGNQQPAFAEATADKQATNTSSENGRAKASPLARKLAAEKGIDLSKVHGTGDGGRITRQDIDSYKETTDDRQRTTEEKPGRGEIKQAETAMKFIPSAPVGEESFEEFPVSQMRKIIAKRLAESKFTSPHFYLTMSIDMDKAVEGRAKLNEVSPVKISFNDLILKACAIALKQHPAVNSSWRGDKIRRNHHVHIGVAVAVEDGLLVPVVRFADSKSLSQIASEVKVFAQKAKDKKLQPSDWEGNTFTISNLGMFGIEEFTAIINPPDACILAVGGIAQVPVVKDGQVRVGNVMKLTMSCDHRIVDGATGSAFLQTLKTLLEEPLRMLV